MYVPLNSKDFAAHKQELLEAVRQAFGWETLKPMPLEEQARMRDYFSRARAMKCSEGIDATSHKEMLLARVFQPRTRNGGPNRAYVEKPDPEVIDTLEAMFDQYVQCHYWRRLNDLRWDRAVPGEGDKHQRCAYALEALEGQIAPFYIHALMERGYSVAHAHKIVGGGVLAFINTVRDSHGTKDLKINPQHDPRKTPEEELLTIEDWAQDHWARVIARQRDVAPSDSEKVASR